MTRYSKFIIVCSTLLLGFGHASFATTHHTPLEPASISSVSSGWQEARIWFLPDWQQDTRSYNSNKNEDPGGGDVIGECGTYGYIQNCGLPKVSTGTVKPRPGLTCQKGCTCPASYQYTSSNCSGDSELGGSTCDGKYNQCNLKPCPAAVNCDYGCKTYSSMSHCSSICIECDEDPCPGYYECGGSWQYCEGTTCPADSSKCSVYCKDDYFPYKCETGETCPGISRGDYCSEPCESTNPCADVSCGANAYCSGGTCYCNSGYEGNADTGCTEIETDPCADVSCGANAYCSGGTCYCNSGYEGNATTGCTEIETDPCADVSCGANAYCSGGSCYCNSGYEGNAYSGCTEIETCTYTTIASDCSSQCKNTGSSSCSRNGTTYYNGCGSSKCSSGQSCSSGTCICNTTCTHTVTTKPANSSYTTSSCTACGVTSTINTGWNCNSGYTKSGSSCVCATTCSDTVTTKPANSSYTTSSCTACGVTKTINTGWSCNSGYEKSGDSCVEACTYTITAADCRSQCKYNGSSSCTRDGTTYYSSCGSSRCTGGQRCSDDGVGLCLYPTLPPDTPLVPDDPCREWGHPECLPGYTVQGHCCCPSDWNGNDIYCSCCKVL